MIKKTLLLISLFSLCAFSAAIPTVIDTVTAPVKLIRCIAVTGDTAYYVGKIYYDLHVGDNDSLNISLAFNPVGTGAAIIIDSLRGDAGTTSFVNGINGRNVISFWCHIGGQQAAAYTAQVTIVAGLSGIEKTTDSLLALMTNDEKITQLHGTGTRQGPDVTRLGIPGYYMSNGPDGVCKGAGGNATTFPAPCAMGCMWDTATVNQLAAALGKEFWAKGKYMAEAPIVNLVRDPRGGRSFETFSEDPYLCGKLGVSYVKGMQSVKCAAITKHWVCNDQEDNRKVASSNVNERTLREIYAMPFEYCIKEGKTWGIMSAHNMVRVLPTQAALNPAPWCSANPITLDTILKSNWGFRGYVISDWNAIFNTASAANAGEDVELPNGTYFGAPLSNALASNQVSQARIDDMTKRILRTKVWSGVIGKLGAAATQYASDLQSAATFQLCLDAARKSIVVVKNDGILPLDKTKIYAVLGPTVMTDARDGGLGSGSMTGCSNGIISPLAGITAKVGAANITATWQNADVVIICVGVSGEGEGTDRTTITLEPPTGQLSLISQAIAANKKCVVVMTGGSACTQDVWCNGNGVVIAWYPGQQQGTALADILFGDVNPSGKLPCTWPATLAQMPPFLNSLTNVDVPYEGPDTGRGYRYFDRTKQTPLYAFGFGLSYTTFQYSNISVTPNPATVGDSVVVTATIKNTGTKAGDEVAQLYVSESTPQLPRPVKELRGFARVTLAPGQSKDVSFVLHEREFAYYDNRAGVNRFVAQPDNYTVMVGPSSDSLPLTAPLTLQ